MSRSEKAEEVNLPAIIISATLQEPVDWVDGTVVSGDAVEVVARLKTQRCFGQ